MVKLLKIQEYGNQLLAIFDDGSRILAYPTMIGMWVASANTSGGGGVGSGEYIWPFPTEQITSYFRTPERPTHDGIDFGSGSSNVEGTPIPAISDGTVILAQDYSGYGYTVILDHGPITGGTYDGQVLKTLYAHMVAPGPAVAVNDVVVQGQTLGGIGNTGNSQGNHLHWETWVNDVKIDPMIFMGEYGPA